jgi:hypothetical protein
VVDQVRVPVYAIGDPGAAGDVQGVPAAVVAPVPDVALDAGAVGPLTVRAASVRGAGHRYDGTPRQDDFGLAVAGPAGEWLVVAVADGVSAGPRSHLAARVAVRSGLQQVQAALAASSPDQLAWDEVIGTVAGHVLLQARKEAGDDTLTAGDAAHVMATTLSIVVVPLAAALEPAPATVVALGDTSVWLRRAGVWQSVTAVKNAGEAIASSAVLALPLLPGGPIVPAAPVLEPGDALFVVSDGVGDPLGDGAGVVAEALGRAWSSPPNRYEFAAQVDFHRRSHTDDRTVVGIWFDGAAAPEAEPELRDSDGPPPDPRVDLAPTVPGDASPADGSAPSAAPPGAPGATADDGAPDGPGPAGLGSAGLGSAAPGG